MILQDVASLLRGTIRQVLHREGYHGRVSRRKLYIFKANKLKCLEFAKHVNYPESFWKNVIFSDEIHIRLYDQLLNTVAD